MRTHLLTLALCLSTIAMYAQDTSRSLDEVIVTTTKTGIKESETGKVLTTISSDELRQDEGKSLGEVLNMQPGITINGAEEAPGTNQYIYTRGSADGYTMVLLDGVVVYDASQITSHFDLNLIPVDMIDHIEIIRGAASTLYGSGAVGGVINIITKKGSKKPFGINAAVTGGSYSTFKENLGISGHSGILGYNLSLTNFDSKGFPGAVDTTGIGHFTDDGMDDKSANINLEIRASPKLTIQPFFRYSDENGNIPEGAYSDAENYTYDTKFMQGGLQASYNLEKTTLHMIYSYGFTRRDYLDDTSADNADYYQETDISHMNDGEFWLNSNLSPHISLLAGIQELYASTSQSSLSISSYGPYQTAISPDTAGAGLTSAYLSLFLKNDTGFNLEAGGRLNVHSVYGFNPTFTLNPFYAFAGHHKIFINIASTFNAPSLYQLYSPYGNKDLKPETGISYEAGYESIWMDDRFKIRITGFERNMQDVIAYTTVYVNFNQQHDRGGELEMDYTPNNRINLKGYYAYVTGDVTAQGSGKADTVYNNLYGRPAHSFGLLGSWQVSGSFNFSSDIKYTGLCTGLNFDNYPYTNVNLNPYFLWNMHVAYNRKEKWNIFVDLNNITNSNYTEVLGYATRKFNFDAGLSVIL